MNNRFFSSSPVLLQIGLLLVRLTTGGFLIYHGWEIFSASKMEEYLKWDQFKQNSFGTFLVYLGKGAELVGGILLAIGLFTRVAALIIIGALGYITFFIGKGKIWYDDQHPFMFVLVALIYLFAGGGPYSLDKLLFTNRQTKYYA